MVELDRAEVDLEPIEADLQASELPIETLAQCDETVGDSAYVRACLLVENLDAPEANLHGTETSFHRIEASLHRILAGLDPPQPSFDDCQPVLDGREASVDFREPRIHPRELRREVGHQACGVVRRHELGGVSSLASPQFEFGDETEPCVVGTATLRRHFTTERPPRVQCVPPTYIASVDLPPDVLAQFRRHGRRGGRTRAARLSAQQRASGARRAATARWIRKRFGAADFASLGLPAGEIVDKGLADLAEGATSREALLVSLASARLRREGVPVGMVETNPEERLYALIAETDGGLAHARYNALRQQIVSFADACRSARMDR